MSAVVEIKDAVKTFDKVRAVNGISLSVPEGSVFAVLGRNGAGKTTLLRMVVGLLHPDRGEVRVHGEDPWTLLPETRQRIGYVSEEDFPFPNLVLTEAARLVSGLSVRWDQPYLEKLVADTGLPRDRRLSEMSKGERRMATLVLTLAARPDLLILDDPAIGLDAAARRDFLTAVLTLLRQEGKTVLFSSHILTDVERMADRAAFIDAGKLLLTRSIDELKTGVKRLVLSWDGAAPPDPIDVAGKIREVRQGSEARVTVDRFTDGVAQEAGRRLGARVAVQDLTLEEIFIDYFAGTRS